MPENIFSGSLWKNQRRFFLQFFFNFFQPLIELLQFLEDSLFGRRLSADIAGKSDKNREDIVMLSEVLWKTTPLA